MCSGAHLGVDGDVTGLVAGEADFAALLVTPGDLLAVWGPAGVLTHGALAPEAAKVPDPVRLAGHAVRALGGGTTEFEGIILAAKEEVCLVARVDKVSVVCARDLGRLTAIDPVTGQ